MKDFAIRKRLGLLRRGLRHFLLIGMSFSLLLVANVLMAADAVCRFDLRPASIDNVATLAEQRVAAWRKQLKAQTDVDSLRQIMADDAVNLLLRSNKLESAGQDKDARMLRKLVRRLLPDTDWRIQYQQKQGDLGAIEARIAWLRADDKPDEKAICALAMQGASISGAEALYRLAFCVEPSSLALTHMRRAAALGHLAAIEVEGRLCLSGKLTSDCDFSRLCRAAQAGRLGAASTVGWHLSAQSDSQAADAGAWLQRAAQAGDTVAQNNLGEWHERHGVRDAKNRLALSWYLKSATAGLPAAMVNAARILATGSAVECAQARQWLAQAQAKGLQQAGQWARSLECVTTSEMSK